MRLTLDRKQQVVAFIRAEICGDFHPDEDLLSVLDSMALVKLLMFVQGRFGVAVDVGGLVPRSFASVDALLAATGAVGSA